MNNLGNSPTFDESLPHVKSRRIHMNILNSAPGIVVDEVTREISRMSDRMYRHVNDEIMEISDLLKAQFTR